jgi:two-component system, cell cycle response regulator
MVIMVVEDDPVMLEVLTVGLRAEGHDVVPCQDGETAWELLEAGLGPDLVILDRVLPGMNGLELCRRIRSRESSPYVYVILLTGLRDSTDVIAGMEAGADDYLTKPFHPGEMRARLRAGQRIVELQRDLLETREALRIQAIQDPLTHTLNHGAILDALRTEIDRAGREGHPLSVIMMDLDHFKSANDTHGHVAGDYVLLEASRRVGNILRSYDSLGRYGGDEFLVVLPNTGPEQAKGLAERISGAVSRPPFTYEGNELPITASIGVTTWSGSSPVPAADLVQRADQALYVVKAGGGTESRTSPSRGSPTSATQLFRVGPTDPEREGPDRAVRARFNQGVICPDWVAESTWVPSARFGNCTSIPPAPPAQPEPLAVQNVLTPL